MQAEYGLDWRWIRKNWTFDMLNLILRKYAERMKRQASPSKGQRVSSPEELMRMMS